MLLCSYLFYIILSHFNPSGKNIFHMKKVKRYASLLWTISLSSLYTSFFLYKETAKKAVSSLHYNYRLVVAIYLKVNTSVSLYESA